MALGGSLGLAFWVLDSALFIPPISPNRPFMERLLFPSGLELWLRLAVITLLMVIGIYSQRVRARSSAGHDRSGKERLERQPIGGGNKRTGGLATAPDLKGILAESQRVNEQLRHEIADRLEVEMALHEANARLKAMVQEADQRHWHDTLLNGLGDLLQTSLTSEEAYAIIAPVALELFPDNAGAIFVLDSHKNLLEAAATWGDSLNSEAVFTPDDCWALRRGAIHLVQDVLSGLSCRHISPQSARAHICIPMIAQGEILGMLLLESLPRQTKEGQLDPGGTLTEAKQRLAQSLAKQTSLALANLRLRETLFRQAVRDPLTNLFNRRYLEETLVRELRRAQRQGVPLGVIMIDLDNFKGFNDAFGHGTGDALLFSLARLLERHIRREDIACRFGGEEFTIILPGASLEVARQRAEQLREAISSLHVEDLNRSPVAVTASLGVAAFPDHGETDSDVLWAADAALLAAKAQGRNRVVVATPDRKNPSTGVEHKRLLA